MKQGLHKQSENVYRFISTFRGKQLARTYSSHLKGRVHVFELITSRYLSVDVVAGVAGRDEHGTHVFVAAREPEKLFHQAHILVIQYDVDFCLSYC